MTYELHPPGNCGTMCPMMTHREGAWYKIGYSAKDPARHLPCWRIRCQHYELGFNRAAPFRFAFLSAFSVPRSSTHVLRMHALLPKSATRLKGADSCPIELNSRWNEGIDKVKLFTTDDCNELIVPPLETVFDIHVAHLQPIRQYLSVHGDMVVTFRIIWRSILGSARRVCSGARRPRGQRSKRWQKSRLPLAGRIQSNDCWTTAPSAAFLRLCREHAMRAVE